MTKHNNAVLRHDSIVRLPLHPNNIVVFHNSNAVSYHSNTAEKKHEPHNNYAALSQ